VRFGAIKDNSQAIETAEGESEYYDRNLFIEGRLRCRFDIGRSVSGARRVASLSFYGSPYTQIMATAQKLSIWLQRMSDVEED